MLRRRIFKGLRILGSLIVTDKSCLIVFAKYPVPGTVKTRLAQMTTFEESAAFFSDCLLDSLDRYLDLNCADVVLFMAGEDSVNFTSLLPRGVKIFRQSGEGLGERMLNAFREMFSLGYARVGIIGTDHPTLPSSHILGAFSALQSKASIVIGPSEDGGYYLLGMGHLIPRLFRDMTYSHAEVFAETLARAREDLVDVLEALPKWYDVDEPKDLKRLSIDLETCTLALPRVRKIVKKLRDTYQDHSEFV